MTLGEFYTVGAKQNWCSLWRTKHCPVCTRHVRCLVPSTNWPLSDFLSARPLKFIGLSGVPSDCPVRQQSNCQLRPTVNCADCGAVCSTEVRSQSATSGYTGLSDVPPDCPVQQEDKRLQRSTAPNPNDRLTWNSPDSKSGVSGVPINSND
jgi:hypothetical protein